MTIHADCNGYYGEFGGAFVPELLQPNIIELRKTYKKKIYNDDFQEQFNNLLKYYVGRPTPLYFAKNLSKKYKTNIYLKREDLAFTGSHKINNTIGQILLAKHMEKKNIIAETGAGQHGVATAVVCAKFGMNCIIHMGEVDIKKQSSNVAKMQMLGAKIIPTLTGGKTLKDATNEAIRYWIAHPEDYYLLGSVVGPHPYPEIVMHFQSVISKEIKSQLKVLQKKEYPNHVIACVGGGSNAAGSFYHFLENKSINFIGAEAAGVGINTCRHAASISKGKVGFLHGSKSLLLQDEFGQVVEPHSISSGLDYPGIGPLHAHLHKIGKVTYLPVTDSEALQAALKITEEEGIIPALESAHALAVLDKLKFFPDETLVICLSGRGDKDMDTYEKYLNQFADNE